MRERDSVHKEIEKLQDDLMQSNKKIKTLEIKSNEIHDEKKILLYEVESLRREIKSALDDRDNALKVSFLNYVMLHCLPCTFKLFLRSCITCEKGVENIKNHSGMKT